MPRYEFACRGCGKRFEDLCRYEDIPSVRCGCGSEADKLVSVPAKVRFTDPKGTSLEDNFDYVAQTNYANAQELRRRAESRDEHRYNDIDDIGSGLHEGEVK